VAPTASCTFRKRDKFLASAANQTHITQPAVQSLYYYITNLFYSKILKYGTADMVVL
jgi:hypothetical protein